MKYISDEDKMRVALDEARKALDIDEVPVGAAIFDKDDNLSLIHISEPRDRSLSRMPSSA